MKTVTMTFLVGLVFELRALCSQRRRFTTWVTPPSPFCSGYFWRWGLENYLPRLANNLPVILQISASQVARIVGVSHQCQQQWLLDDRNCYFWLTECEIKSLSPKEKAIGLVEWLVWESTCLASTKPWV
jgi:hypothetical protein